MWNDILHFVNISTWASSNWHVSIEFWRGALYRCDGVRCWFWKHSILQMAWHTPPYRIQLRIRIARIRWANVYWCEYTNTTPQRLLHIYIGPFSPIVGTHILPLVIRCAAHTLRTSFDLDVLVFLVHVSFCRFRVFCTFGTAQNNGTVSGSGILFCSVGAMKSGQLHTNRRLRTWQCFWIWLIFCDWRE